MQVKLLVDEPEAIRFEGNFKMLMKIHLNSTTQGSVLTANFVTKNGAFCTENQIVISPHIKGAKQAMLAYFSIQLDKFCI